MSTINSIDACRITRRGTVVRGNGCVVFAEYCVLDGNNGRLHASNCIINGSGWRIYPEAENVTDLGVNNGRVGATPAKPDANRERDRSPSTRPAMCHRCQTEPIGAMLMPCGHATLCLACAPSAAAPVACPVCSAVSRRFRPVYL